VNVGLFSVNYLLQVLYSLKQNVTLEAALVFVRIYVLTSTGIPAMAVLLLIVTEVTC